MRQFLFDLRSFHFQLKRIIVPSQNQLLREFPAEIKNARQVFEARATSYIPKQEYYLGLIYQTNRGNWKHLETVDRDYSSPVFAAKSLLQRMLGFNPIDFAKEVELTLVKT